LKEKFRLEIRQNLVRAVSDIFFNPLSANVEL